MTRLVFDIETNDLPPNVKKIWCIVAKDLDTKHVYTFGPETIEQGVSFLQRADYLVGHNIIGFDIPVIEELMDVKLGREGVSIVDTHALSRLFNPTRDGGHSLAAWGSRLGTAKIKFEEFGRYSGEMLEYCIRDVELNEKVYHELRKEGKGFSKESVALENGVSRILYGQRKNGFLFDHISAEILKARLEERMEDIKREVQAIFKPRVTEVKLYAQFTKTGTLAKIAKTLEDKGVRLTDEEYQELSGFTHRPISRYMIAEFNLSSRPQISERLQELGWKPDKFTPNGRPTVDEQVLLGIEEIPVAGLIAEYMLLQKRVAQIGGKKGWLEYVQDDGRVHGSVISNGTITGRMTHQQPNMAQVPSVSSPYGKECRSCWIVPPGHKLVGVDASQLELRMLAHYMKDENYINEIVNGDIHSTNQKIAGLQSRDQAKTFIYALLYGAGDRKLGTVVGRSPSSGKELRKHFFDNLPSFRSLRERVSAAAQRGFLKGLDGRKIFVRSEHSALNTLLQSAGALVMKQALIILNESIKWHGLSAKYVANVHDEWQIEVIEKDAVRVGELAVDAIKETASVFNLICPLDGEYTIGDNWSETH